MEAAVCFQPGANGGFRSAREAITTPSALWRRVHGSFASLRMTMLDCRLELQEIELQLCVSLLLGPKIEWDRRHLIHDRFGAAALRHVHGFYIAPATVASFHPDV